MPYIIRTRTAVLSIDWGWAPRLNSRSWQQPYLMTSKKKARKSLTIFLGHENARRKAQGKEPMSRKDFFITPIYLEFPQLPAVKCTA